MRDYEYLDNDKLMDHNSFEFTTYEINRLTDLFATLQLDDYIRKCYARELAKMDPAQVREMRFKAEKITEYLVEIGKIVIDAEDPDE